MYGAAKHVISERGLSTRLLSLYLALGQDTLHTYFIMLAQIIIEQNAPTPSLIRALGVEFFFDGSDAINAVLSLF